MCIMHILLSSLGHIGLDIHNCTSKPASLYIWVHLLNHDFFIKSTYKTLTCTYMKWW